MQSSHPKLAEQPIEPLSSRIITILDMHILDRSVPDTHLDFHKRAQSFDIIKMDPRAVQNEPATITSTAS